MSSKVQKLTIKNYHKLENAAHPEFSCIQINEFGNYYSIGIKSDTDDFTAMVKISRREKKYEPNIYETSLTWVEDGKTQTEVTSLNRDDMLDYKYFFMLLCETIKTIRQPNFPF